MGAEDLQKVIRNAVRACINPTDLSLPWPHGGVGLGAIRGAYAEPGIAHADIRAEEWGVEVVESIYLGESWTVGLLLRQYDDDVVGTIFPNVKTGGETSTKMVYHDASATRRAGARGSTIAVKLLLTPRDIRDDTTGKAVYFPRAMPMLERAAQVRHNLVSEMSFPAIFRAIRDTTGRMYQFGALDDIELTPP